MDKAKERNHSESEMLWSATAMGCAAGLWVSDRGCHSALCCFLLPGTTSEMQTTFVQSHQAWKSPCHWAATKHVQRNSSLDKLGSTTTLFVCSGNLHGRRINIFMAVIRSSLDVIRRSVVFVALISEFFAIFTVLIFTVLIMQTGK